MTGSISLDAVRHAASLGKWLADCRAKMSKRYPKIDFDADVWPVRSLYQTKLEDVRLGPLQHDFKSRDPSFGDCARALAAEVVLSKSIKTIRNHLEGYRLLALTDATSLFDLNLLDIKTIERAVTKTAKERAQSAAMALTNLDSLGRHLSILSKKGVVPLLAYKPGKELRSELISLSRTHLRKRHSAKRDILDHQIEALSVAMNAMAAGDPRLTQLDQVVLSCFGLEMCAPSRINEVLCLSNDDYVSVDDYVVKASGQERDKVQQVHQALIITMKGSKGASWGAKPVLNFMIELFNHCLSTVLKYGERSRMLANWYEEHPDTLYLPPELEYLRGRDITKSDLWKIANLREPEEGASVWQVHTSLYKGIQEKGHRVPNSKLDSLGRRATSHVAIPWVEVERYLLGRVQKAMADCRRVTIDNKYEGALSKMLFLIDTDELPFIPASLKYAQLLRRVHQTDAYKASALRRYGSLPEPTIFEKLGITMPVDGVIRTAFISTHDPRKWLTTQALSAKEKLSDVLINKWARRLDIEQLRHYDFRTSEHKAAQSAMPLPTELLDLSKGLASAKRVEDDFGLKTDLVTIADAGIHVTSMEAIASAVENRPIARTSEQILVLYPTWYGACVHQHHETPCRAYSGSCLPCDNNHVVKGHLPTNERIRARANLLHTSLVNQLESLALAHNRGIPDDPDSLASHLLTLVRESFNPEQMARELVERFHEIKRDIKDICFANKLEEAFVATGMVQRLNDPKVPAGALIKYHNAARHASPGVERAIEATGGREKLEADRERVSSKYPEFAATTLGLADQRSLVEQDEDDGDEE